MSADIPAYDPRMSPTPGLLTSVLSGLWDAIAAEHSELPPHARIATVSSPRGPRHGHERWSLDDDGYLVGLAVDVDTLTEGVEATIRHIFHEAAHVLAWRRGIQETSMRGVYHNGAYLEIAQSLGMSWPDSERVAGKGWSVPVLGPILTKRLTSMNDADRLAAVARQLGPAIESTLPYLQSSTTTGSFRVDRETAACQCDPPRKLRISATVLALGPVTCGVCGAEFVVQ